MPSRSKIASVNTVPESRNAKSRPKIVTTGTSAERRACWVTTFRVFRPLALAVRT